MPDITTVNAATRIWLDSNGFKNVSLGFPIFRNDLWLVMVYSRKKFVGVVILDANGIVDTEISFPNK